MVVCCYCSQGDIMSKIGFDRSDRGDEPSGGYLSYTPLGNESNTRQSTSDGRCKISTSRAFFKYIRRDKKQQSNSNKWCKITTSRAWFIILLQRPETEFQHTQQSTAGREIVTGEFSCMQQSVEWNAQQQFDKRESEAKNANNNQPGVEAFTDKRTIYRRENTTIESTIMNFNMSKQKSINTLN